METIETKYQNGNLNEKFEASLYESGGNIKDGKYEKWYESGTKECEGEYLDGKKFGYWKYWYENGDPKEEGEYMDDVRMGKWKSFERNEISSLAQNKHNEIIEQNINEDLEQDTLSETEDNKLISEEKDVSINEDIEDDSMKLSETQDNSSKISTEPKSVIQPALQPKATKTPYLYIGLGSIILAIIILVFINSLSDKKDKSENLSQNISESENQDKVNELKKKEADLNKQEEQIKYQANLYTPQGVSIKFIESLGKSDFSAAFGLMTEKRRGSYSFFSSTKGYGGITSTNVFNCSLIGETNGKYEVLIDYESIDPANKSGRFKQYFYLIPFNDSYLISEIKNLSIEWY